MIGGRRSERFRVWQLADQLRSAVADLASGEALSGDHRLQAQIDDACGEVRRNIAEALAADRDREFARFLRLARAAINELQLGLRLALIKKYVAERDLKNVRETLATLYPALCSLLANGHNSSDRRSA